MKDSLPLPIPEFIYHLVLKSEFIMQIRENFYTPVSFVKDGFIHCTNGEDLTLVIANDKFSKAKNLLALKIRLEKIMAEVIFESPNRIDDKLSSSLTQNILYPHIYGSLNLDSIEGIATVPNINYVFHFPKNFYTFSQFKEGIQWF